MMTWILGVYMKNIPGGLLSLSPNKWAFNSELMRKPSGTWDPQKSEHLTYRAPGGGRQDVGNRQILGTELVFPHLPNMWPMSTWLWSGLRHSWLMAIISSRLWSL